MSLVSFVKIEKSDMKKAIEDSLDLLNYRFKKGIQKVVIKPNMCYYWDYSTGQTTDPKFVGAVIDLIREKILPDPDICIVESDASAMKCRHVFKMLGYEKLSQNYGVRLVNLSEDKSDIVKATVGNRSIQLMVPRTVRDADLRINVPKIKYSSEQLKITCALKNIFGCNPYQKKSRFHPIIEDFIVAINKAMRFDLCIIDGNIVSGTETRRIGLVMASEDSVAIDVAAAKIAGVNPNTIGYIQLAYKEGLGDKSFIWKGVPLSYFKKRYPKKDATQKLRSKSYGILVRTSVGRRFGLE